MEPPEIVIRPLAPSDSMAEMTGLLHRAYGALVRMGFHYWASHQSEEDTRRRTEKGDCFVAVRGGRLVGTVTARRGGADEEVPEYQSGEVFIFGQFAVEPSLQKEGLGSRLLERAEEEARRRGGRKILCDTSEGAGHLIRYYEKRGYGIVGNVKHEGVNYRSVILEKLLV